MAVFNFGLCVMLLFQLSAVVTDETSSESTDLGLNERKDADVSDVDGVRCYCNTAQCVGTAYMCRSPLGGGCYSEVPAPRRAHHARHGCLHHLADTEKEALARCQNTPSASTPAPSSQNSLLLCCFHDLCNHEDSPVARARLNLTSDSEGSAVASEPGVGYNDGEVWFRVATIVVPLCGSLILFILVVVAIKMLRPDSLSHSDRKVSGGYITPLAQHPCDQDVKKVWIGSAASPLLVTPGGCLVAVERAQLVDTSCKPFCDIQR